MKITILSILICFSGCVKHNYHIQATSESNAIIDNIIKATVMVESQNNIGTGVVIKRKDCVFIWTAAHIFDKVDKGSTSIRQSNIRPAISRWGYKDGKWQIIAYVFGDLVKIDSSLDIALIIISDPRDCIFFTHGIEFEPEKPNVGSPVYHVGHFAGFLYNYSLSDGIVSFVGRMQPLAVDQSTCTVRKGSSGGGIFLKSTGKCIGLVSRTQSDGDNSNIFIPSREIVKWCQKNGIMFAANVNLPRVSN